MRQLHQQPEQHRHPQQHDHVGDQPGPTAARQGAVGRVRANKRSSRTSSRDQRRRRGDLRSGRGRAESWRHGRGTDHDHPVLIAYHLPSVTPHAAQHLIEAVLNTQSLAQMNNRRHSGDHADPTETLPAGHRSATRGRRPHLRPALRPRPTAPGAAARRRRTTTSPPSPRRPAPPSRQPASNWPSCAPPESSPPAATAAASSTASTTRTSSRSSSNVPATSHPTAPSHPTPPATPTPPAPIRDTRLPRLRHERPTARDG